MFRIRTCRLWFVLCVRNLLMKMERERDLKCKVQLVLRDSVLFFVQEYKVHAFVEISRFYYMVPREKRVLDCTITCPSGLGGTIKWWYI